MEIKAREKLRARRNKEHGGKKNVVRKKKEEALRKRKGGWIKHIRGMKEGKKEGKLHVFLKKEAKYKVKEIKLLQEIGTPPV